MQLLNLIDEKGVPTDDFETIRRAPEAELKSRMQDWLKTAYHDVFTIVDPSKDDATRIRDAFRNYTPTGQQDRMTVLFTGLCTAAGLIPEKPKTAAPRPVANSAKPRPVVNFTRMKVRTPAPAAPFKARRTCRLPWRGFSPACPRTERAGHDFKEISSSPPSAL